MPPYITYICPSRSTLDISPLLVEKIGKPLFNCSLDNRQALHKKKISFSTGLLVSRSCYMLSNVPLKLQSLGCSGSKKFHSLLSTYAKHRVFSALGYSLLDPAGNWAVGAALLKPIPLTLMKCNCVSFCTSAFPE